MKIYITKRFIITAIIAIPVIIAGYFIIDYKYDKYIINNTIDTYNTIKDAYAKTIKTANYQWEDGKIDTESFSKEFIKNLPVKKDCAFKGTDCFPLDMHSNYTTTVVPPSLGIYDMSYYKVMLENNVGLAIKISSPTCSELNNSCGTIVMDVNSKKIGPNMFSRDLFDVGIYKDKIDLYSLEGNMYPNCMCGGGQFCTAFVVKFKSRDYKKFPEYEKEYKLQFVNHTRYPRGERFLRKNVRNNILNETCFN